MSKKKSKMTPEQCSEEMDQLLAMQQEAADLKAKLDKVAEAHKDAKAKYDVKSDEIITHLEELNRELPLFDKPEDTPWPFPVPEDCHDAHLGVIAVQANVLGLTTGIVKHVHDSYGVLTLGKLQAVLGANEKFSTDQMNKAKRAMGERLGANSAVKLLRAIASFTGSRKKAPAGKKPDPVPVNPDKGPEKPKPAKDAAWLSTRLTKLITDQDVVLKHLAGKDVVTVGDMLNKVDGYNAAAKKQGGLTNPNHVALSLVQEFGMQLPVAKKIIKAVFDFEEENTVEKK